MLKTRIFTALVLGSATVISILLLPTWAFAVILGFPWLVGAREWIGFVPEFRQLTKAYCIIFLLIMLGVGPLFDARGAELIACLACGWWLLAYLFLWAYPRRLPTSIVMVSGPIALLPAWFLLVYLHGSESHGPLMVLVLVGTIWVADIGAYFFGRRFGKIKLAKNISPSKTWEGVIGGLMLAAVVALFASIALDIPSIAFVSIALAAAIVSVVGDLTISMLKRHAGLKDSGWLLPGHGGVLDRIDSISAAVPLFFFGIQMVGI